MTKIPEYTYVKGDKIRGRDGRPVHSFNLNKEFDQKTLDRLEKEGIIKKKSKGEKNDG